MPSREIELNKTKGTQYVETNEHPVQSNEIRHGGVSSALNLYLII